MLPAQQLQQHQPKYQSRLQDTTKQSSASVQKSAPTSNTATSPQLQNNPVNLNQQNQQQSTVGNNPLSSSLTVTGQLNVYNNATAAVSSSSIYPQQQQRGGLISTLPATTVVSSQPQNLVGRTQQGSVGGPTQSQQQVPQPSQPQQQQSYQNFATPYGYPQPTHIYYPDPNNMPIQFLSQGGPYGNPSGAHPQAYNIYSNWQGQEKPQRK